MHMQNSDKSELWDLFSQLQKYKFAILREKKSKLWDTKSQLQEKSQTQLLFVIYIFIP